MLVLFLVDIGEVIFKINLLKSKKTKVYVNQRKSLADLKPLLSTVVISFVFSSRIITYNKS